MNGPQATLDYYHLAGTLLQVGSVIAPGNWGRIIRATGWRHPEAVKEMALEYVRRLNCPDKPSRLESAFAFLTVDEARNFRGRIAGFGSHTLYRVGLVARDAPSHIADSRLSGPQGALHDNWPEDYWREYDPATIAVPGIDNWVACASSSPGGLHSRELLTLSALVIRDRID